MESIIKIKNLVKKYSDLSVLNGIDLEIKKGQVISIIGPSGSGKTTLLRCVGMLEKVDAGKIILDEKSMINKNSEEKEIKKIRDKIGVVFQDFNLWPHKTVLENIIYAPINVKKEEKDIVIKKAKKILKKVGLLDKAEEYPNTLSGGQKQRVAIARTLVMEPEVVLFDEITSALDPELVGGILKIIKRLAKEGMTLLVVTHHMKFASEISDKIVFLDDGKIVEIGSSQQILKRPKEKRTKEFLKTIIEEKQEINVYEGYEDFRAFLIGLLKRVESGTTCYVLGAAGDRWYECIGNTIKEYEKLRLEKKIKWKMVLYNLSAKEKKSLKDLSGLTDYRIIPKELNVPGNINIWGDTILLQTFGDPPAIIEVKNKDLAYAYLNYFKLLWERGEKVE